MPSSRRQRKHPSLYVLRTWAILCKPVRLTAKVAEEGFEQIEELSETSNICAEGSAKSSALLTEMHHLDPQLQLLIEAWPTLSKAVQQQIILLVA